MNELFATKKMVYFLFGSMRIYFCVILDHSEHFRKFIIFYRAFSGYNRKKLITNLNNFVTRFSQFEALYEHIFFFTNYRENEL